MAEPKGPGGTPEPIKDGPKSITEQKERKIVRILLADDDKYLREDLRLFFESKGCVVEAVENGQLLLDKLTTGEYDIVVTDNSMPLVTGIQALKKIRAMENTKNLPVIVLSSYLSPSQEGIVENFGGVYLNKGNSNKDIYSKIIKLVDDTK